MKRKPWLAVAAVAGAVVAYTVLDFSDPEPVAEPQAKAPAPQAKPAPLPVIQPTQPKPQVEAAIEQQLASLSDTIKAQIKYPDHSLPLAEDQYDLLNPNSESFTDRPYDLNGIKGRIRIDTDRFRYAVGDVIEGSLKVEGGNDFFDIIQRLSITLKTADRNTLLQEPIRLSRETQTFQLPTAAAQSGEHLVGVEIDLFGSDDLYQSAPIELIQYVARFEGVGDAYTTPNELRIPMQVEFDNDGFHRIRANFFDADGRPVAHLQEKALVPAKEALEFRVSGALLFERQAQPPYELRDIIIEYIPAEADADLGFGRASAGAYGVDIEFDLDIFAEAVDEVSEENLARLQFLETISGQ